MVKFQTRKEWWAWYDVQRTGCGRGEARQLHLGGKVLSLLPRLEPSDSLKPGCLEHEGNSLSLLAINLRPVLLSFGTGVILFQRFGTQCKHQVL